MAVPDQDPISSHTASGASGVFAYSFQIAAASDLAVTADGVLLTLNIDYTVSGVGVETGGTITVTPTPLSGVAITIYRDTALERLDDFQTAGDLPAAQVNLELDRLWRALQEIFSGGKGAPTALRVPRGETVPALPAAASRALKMLVFDGNGDPVAAVTPTGTAADVLVQLLNTSDVTKGDALVGVKQPYTGTVARTQHQKNADFSTLEDFGAAGNGADDDSAAFVKALAALPTVFGKPGSTYLVNSTVSVAAGKRLIGNGATIKSAAGITTFRFTGNDITFADWDVDANGALYFIRNDGVRNTVRKNRFTGNVGHYVFSPAGSSATRLADNVFDGKGTALITTSVVFEDSTHINVTGNRFYDIEHWCVQVRGASSRVLISQNTCFGSEYTASVTATAAQTVFNFTLSNPCHLAGIQVNGVPFDTGLTFIPTVPAATPTTSWQVTFAVGRTAGDVVTLIAHRAAENIQINGTTTDFTIIGNTCSGGGDSGIVVAGSSLRGTIIGNSIRDIAYTGISLEGGVQQVAIVGNSITRTSLVTTTATYSSGILVGGPDNTVVGNTINNVFGAPTAKYGISINYYATEDGAFDESIKIGQNNYSGVFVQKLYIPNQSATQKRQSIGLMDGVTTNYPERINLDSAFTNTPANTNYWTYTGFGGTISIRDTTIKQGGAASLKTVAGEYIDMYPTAVGAWQDCIVNLSFWAINNSGSSYATVLLDVGGSVVGSPSVTITDTGWRQYNINFPISANEVVASLRIRIGGNTGFANFQHFELTMTKIS